MNLKTALVLGIGFFCFLIGFDRVSSAYENAKVNISRSGGSTTWRIDDQKKSSSELLGDRMIWLGIGLILIGAYSFVKEGTQKETNEAQTEVAGDHCPPDQQPL